MCEVQGEIAKAMKTIQVLSLGEKLIEADDEVVKVKLKKSAKAEVGCDKTGPHGNGCVSCSFAHNVYLLSGCMKLHSGN